MSIAATSVAALLKSRPAPLFTKARRSLIRTGNLEDDLPKLAHVDWVIEAVREDMVSALPMDRVVCGDVGFGKTEVAMRAAFIVANSGKQVAILVPTTLLAQQHFQNFKDRFADWPIRVECLSRFNTKKKQDDIVAQLKSGKVDIVIGTHRLLSADVSFANLGLVVIQPNDLATFEAELTAEQRLDLGPLVHVGDFLRHPADGDFEGCEDTSYRNECYRRCDTGLGDCLISGTCYADGAAKPGARAIVQVGGVPAVEEQLAPAIAVQVPQRGRRFDRVHVAARRVGRGGGTSSRPGSPYREIWTLLSTGVYHMQPACIIAGDASAKSANVLLTEMRLANGLGGKSFYLMVGDVFSVWNFLDVRVAIHARPHFVGLVKKTAFRIVNLHHVGVCGCRTIGVGMAFHAGFIVGEVDDLETLAGQMLDQLRAFDIAIA